MVRVLVPLDGSERSFAAMERGLAPLRDSRLEVTLFVVMHKGFEKAGQDRVEQFERDEHDEIFPTEASSLAALHDAQARLKKLGIRSSIKTVRGRVRHEIFKESAHHDVVLMHRLGPSRLLPRLRMSSTLWLARHAKCAVLLAGD
jgi:nucleotide-binding universal stress UspA family protein